MAQYLEFCGFKDCEFGDNIAMFFHEQYINIHHLFSANLAVNSLLNKYEMPCVLVAILCDNVDFFNENLKKKSLNNSAEENDSKGPNVLKLCSLLYSSQKHSSILYFSITLY
jgi:hypothetical protein